MLLPPAHAAVRRARRAFQAKKDARPPPHVLRALGVAQGPDGGDDRLKIDVWQYHSLHGAKLSAPADIPHPTCRHPGGSVRVPEPASLRAVKAAELRRSRERRHLSPCPPLPRWRGGGPPSPPSHAH